MEKVLVLNSVEDNLHYAVIENNRLVEIVSDEEEKLTGNIYLGRVEKVVNALDAIFVNIGNKKNGFLRLKDIPEEYYNYFSLKKIDKGTKLLVQVKKDPVGDKGPQLTANISIAGRYMVLFPFSKVIGVSKKIEDENERARLHDIAKYISENSNLGVIIRTAAEGLDESYIQSEMDLLANRAFEVLEIFKRKRKAQILYKEENLLDYVLREKLTKDVRLIITNNLKHLETIKKYLKIFIKRPKIEIIDGDTFDYMNIYKYFRELFSRKVSLPSGGEIIIDKTEALTIIDVNSKHFVKGKSQQETAFQTNKEAVSEIFRQLRLRNIGGIVLVDFIDMDSNDMKNMLLEQINEEIKKDKSKIEIFGFTKLGLLEMSRKRTVRSFFENYISPCPVCGGAGFIVSPKITIKNLYQKIEEAPKEAKEVIIKLHPHFKNLIEKSKLKKVKDLVYHIHFTYHDPKSFEITWKI
ncbi:ribonuclease [Thermosipho sp. 1063]|uniref:Rne/Rng family ribonuclease n=1 Tax=unclassified Thermosipho (in: thermotogales) TaxID=2676525 RepID=UPI0009493975|nr:MULTISPECIES: Rne/Rng family ribonuclease [unclassified Thermosipho (in: thermotogales)]ANQ52984.1 ribonuclease [Thermosipho sp. 1070]APT71431.1 ribonuclease [Thermosipho sp. 1063]